MLTILYVTLDFFLNNVNVNDCLCKLLQDNFTQTKKRLPWAVKFYSLHNSNINISHQQSHFQIFKNTNIAKLQRTIEYISDHLQRTLFQLCIVILSSSLLIKKKNIDHSVSKGNCFGKRIEITNYCKISSSRLKILADKK